MGHSILIGDRSFNSKKEALSHYKIILNSYAFGEVLNHSDTNEILSLVNAQPKFKEKAEMEIMTVRIAKLKYNTKCFELVKVDNSTEYLSYTKSINPPKNDFAKFREACRQAIQKDLRKVKLAYFEKHSKKGQVKCQETGEILKYEDLNVDHRQPNTFSVIVDRFMEIRNISLEQVEYLQVQGGPDEMLDNNLKEEFKRYHREKANLRIVKKTLNLGRSYQARTVRQKKDLIIT